MNTLTKEARLKRAQNKRLEYRLLFIAVATMSFWLAYSIFSSNRCDFTGSKLAVVIVPLCMSMGNIAAAAFPFMVGCFFLVIAVWSTWPRVSASQQAKGHK